MASHKSAIKKMKQDKVRRNRRRTHVSRIRTEMKKIRLAVSEGDTESAKKQLSGIESSLDHGASLGILHRNAAARTKSRLARQVGALSRT